MSIKKEETKGETKMKKRIISMVLAVSLVFTMSGVAYAQEAPEKAIVVENGLSDYEIQEIAEEIEATESENSYVEERLSAEEIEEYVESVDGIEYTEIEEENISAEEAVEDVFNDDEISELNLTESEITEYEDTKYITEIYKDGNITYVKTYSEDMLQMSLVSYDGETILSDNYIYNNEIGEFEKQHLEFVCEDTENETTNDVHAQAIKYGSKTKSAEWKDSIFWYQTGNNGSKTYLKIGCKATYRIRTDNLSSTKDKKCDKYMSAVKSSKSHETKAIAYAAGTGVSIGVITGLILANVYFPPSTIVTVVFGIVGGGASVYNAVEHCVDSYEKWLDAKDYYNTIKSYGTKL